MFEFNALIFQEMGKILSHPRVYSFLHVPVQSGSDSVLADMKREYCRKEFEQVVDTLRERQVLLRFRTSNLVRSNSETDVSNGMDK